MHTHKKQERKKKITENNKADLKLWARKSPPFKSANKRQNTGNSHNNGKQQIYARLYGYCIFYITLKATYHNESDDAYTSTYCTQDTVCESVLYWCTYNTYTIGKDKRQIDNNSNNTETIIIKFKSCAYNIYQNNNTIKICIKCTQT